MFIITNSYQYYSIKILTPIFMPILVMPVCPGSSVCSLFVPVVTLQNHTTSYSLNQYSVCLSPERKQHSMLVVLYGAFDVVTANDLWYKIWRWNVDLLLKLVIFLVTWSSKIENHYWWCVYYKSTIVLQPCNCWDARNYFTVSKITKFFPSNTKKTEQTAI